jgi:hypothetical protein
MAPSRPPWENADGTPTPDANQYSVANRRARAAAQAHDPPPNRQPRPREGMSEELRRALQDASTAGDQQAAESLISDFPNLANPRRNKYFSIEIEHIPTGESVHFDGWVTQFADNFTSQWKGTPVYGRMDDLYTFQRTGRKISIAFDVPAVDLKEGQLNAFNLNRLAQFLYPVYSNDRQPDHQIIAAAPLLKMKWTGLIQNAQTGEALVGFLQGFSFAGGVEHGPLLPKYRDTTNPTILYKHHSVQLEFTVLHTHQTGWSTASKGLGGSKYSFGDKDGTWDIEKHFPHDVGAGFDGATALPADGPNPYISALPAPGRSRASEQLAAVGESIVADLKKENERKKNEQQARQQRVLEATADRTERADNRWAATHPRRAAAGETRTSRGHIGSGGPRRG